MENHQFAYRFYPNQAGFINAPAQSLSGAAAPFAVAGVAYDGAVTNRPGARFAPQAIRKASQMLCDATHPEFAVSPQPHLIDVGDLPLPNTSIDGMRAALAPLASELINHFSMLWLGGDHSITLPLLRAYRAKVGKPLALLHFDAHCDTWADHFGEPSGHGSWVYEAHQEGLIDMQRTVQIGIRSPGAQADVAYVKHHGGAIFTAKECRGLENAAQLASVITECKSRLLADGVVPYLSLDIDCLDPAFAPGTGTPEPGGLSTNQVLTILESLSDVPWAGMDICEVSPPYDHAELSSNAAAVFGWTYLSGQCKRLGLQ